MKLLHLLLPLLLFLLLCGPLCARPVTLEWDANPPAEDVVKYFIEAFQGGAWVKVGETVETPGPVAVPPATVLTLATFPDTQTRVRAFAVNRQGFTSEPSDELIVYPQPGPPGKLRIKVALQVSRDGMHSWETLYAHEETADGAAFFRSLLTAVP